MVRVLSLGAGVQSTTVLLMAHQGELPAFDHIVFADTGWEPRAVYRHLDWISEKVVTPVTRVSAGNLRDDALADKSSAWMPLHIRNLNGQPGILRRQCTSNYKLTPIRRALRELGATRKNPVDLSIGISLDEAHRMRTPDVQYIQNHYPLVDLRMTRWDCLRWLERHGYPEPPKSSCIGCPYHDDRLWRRMRDEQPEEWADAVDFDSRIRNGSSGYGNAYLHGDLVPLDEVDLSTERDHGQLDLFGEECEGLCGV